MVGRSVDKKDEIRAYIKARSKLGCSLKKLMTEISTAFGPSCVSYDTVWRWKKKFESGVESIKNAPKSGRPKSASRKEIVSKIKEIIEGDAKFTVRDIARKVSLSTVHLILKKHLKVRKISARWVPHLLTDEQKKQQVKVAKKLLQMFPKYDKKQFANVVTPIIAKRSLSTKKVLYAIFSGEGVAIKVPVKKGQKHHRKVLQRRSIEATEKVLSEKRRPATGFKHVRLLHDNAPAHTSAIVTAFLKKEKVTVLPHPPSSPDLAPCDFILFPKLKAFLAGQKYQSRQAPGSAILQYLITVPTSAYRDAFKKWIHHLKLCISSHGEYFEGMK